MFGAVVVKDPRYLAAALRRSELRSTRAMPGQAEEKALLVEGVPVTSQWFQERGTADAEIEVAPAHCAFGAHAPLPQRATEGLARGNTSTGVLAVVPVAWVVLDNSTWVLGNRVLVCALS